MTMLNIYDRLTRKKTAVLQNAYNITETQEINQIYSLSFTLPYEDEKNKYCLPRHYVRYGDDGELYRIKAPRVSENNTGTITYECEHVITTLCDDVMFGSFTYGGLGINTANTINWVLSKQKTQNWRLGTCAFSRQFEYNWEQENLLNALYSIPKEFAASYMWKFDTVNYPWTISLVEINKNAAPEYYLRAKSNILASGTSADYANICTRIYPLGYGEGVNQLTIKEATVNANGDAVEEGGTRWGKTYIESPQSYIDKYGIVEKVLVDRKFEHANTLYGYAKSMLEVYQEPTMSRSFDVTDLYPITSKPMDDAQVGKICKMTQDNTIAYITRTQRRWDVAGDLQIDLSTKASDIASNVADLADRVRIESVYAQGATQLYQHSKDANASKTKGMILNLYFPSEMKQINKVLLKVQLDKFRSYSQATDGGGAFTVTSASGGGSSVTSASGGGSSATSSSGGGTSSTSSAGGATGNTSTSGASVSGNGGTDEVWENTSGTFSTNSFDSPWADVTEESDVEGPHTHEYYLSIPTLYGPLDQLAHSHSFSVNCGSHSHSFSIGSHTHKFTTPNHTHNVTIPSHTHGVSIPSHTHDVTIPDHTHTITPGIYEDTKNNATAFGIYVGNNLKQNINARTWNGDITQWLLNDKNMIPRDSWIKVEIRPNNLAYVVSSVFVQGFVQSRGGGNY